MHLLEITLRKQILIATNIRDTSFLRDAIRGCDVREWQPGQRMEDVTDPRWREPSHVWLLNRRSDGVGVLQINARVAGAAIDILHQGRRQKVRDIMYVLDRPKKLHLLLGGVTGVHGVREAMLYKMICTTDDDKKLPF